MKTIDTGRHKIELYDSIDELPIRRFHKFNKYLLIDAGIGGDLEDINTLLLKIARYIDKSDKPNAKAELENLRLSIHFVAQETNVKHLSFTALVKSIDGKEVDLASDSDAKKIQEIVGEIPLSTFRGVLSALKKKLMRN